MCVCLSVRTYVCLSICIMLCVCTYEQLLTVCGRATTITTTYSHCVSTYPLPYPPSLFPFLSHLPPSFPPPPLLSPPPPPTPPFLSPPPCPPLGASYNIPVGIYLRKDYPYQCPYCLVQPTPDMMIAPSKYVNQQGVIFLPYLHDWKHVSGRRGRVNRAEQSG